MYLKFLSFLVVILMIPSIYADTNGIWLDAKDIRAGTFGSDEEAGNFTFPNNLEITNKAIIEGNENSLQLVGEDHSYVEFYPQGMSSGRESWLGFGESGDTEFTIQDSSNLLLNPFGGFVGVGTQTPNSKLDVNGNIIGEDIYSNGELVSTQNWVINRDNDTNATNEIQNLNEVLNLGNDGGGQRIENIGNPNSYDDAATKGYVDDSIASNDIRICVECKGRLGGGGKRCTTNGWSSWTTPKFNDDQLTTGELECRVYISQ